MSTGVHYIFAGGTGVLPFLDLFFCMLKLSIQYGEKEKR
jgi:hypothetical protein